MDRLTGKMLSLAHLPSHSRLFVWQRLARHRTWASTREFFVFNIWWRDASLLEQPPSVDVAARVGLEVAVFLGFAERSAVEEQLAIHYPEYADVGFFFWRWAGG